MAQYSIKDVEMLSGVKAHTLRVWEQRYQFLKPQRTDTNIRYYSDDQLRQILNISLLNRNGYKISKIANMTDDELRSEVMHLSQQVHTAGNLLDSLVHSMLEFDEARFEKTLSTAIMKMGFEQTFTQLIFPFMIRTGILWATGSVRPAQEHFITNLIRRKISVAIDNQYVERNERTKKFVLFLPEGETHELLLLFTEYVLRSKNHEVAYLGNSVPFDDVEFINEVFKPDYLITYLTVQPKEMPVQDYINKLAFSFPQKKIIIGGSQFDLQQQLQIPSNVVLVRSLEQVQSVIN